MRRLARVATLVAWTLGAATAHADSGRLIFEGGHPALRSATLAHDAGAPVPPEQAACASCHRPSGLGSFEGDAVVPPIASGTLAAPYDPATTRRYAPSPLLRVRPAYDAAALQRLLTQGETPDGRALGSLMPRYRVTLDESAALLSHLNRLGADPTPGVDDDEVHFATVTTDDVGPEREADLIGVLNTFFEHKNATTRSEPRRRASAQRNEQVMYRRWRRWTLHHWRLSGPPAGWPAQLAAQYAQRPVFALLSGTGARDWTPVQAFCERERLPCLFPVTPFPGPRDGFYSAYFSGGAPAQARWLAADLLRRDEGAARPAVQVIAGDDAEGRAQGERIADALREAGLETGVGPAWAGAPVVVSALPPAALAARLPAPASARLPRELHLLAGAAPADGTARALAPWVGRVDIGWVTQQRTGAATLARARAWWRGRALRPHDEAFAAQVLFAATTALESLVHVDERFSREYCLEKLEHNLENMPPLTGYPRLALGPGQRLAAREVWREPLR